MSEQKHWSECLISRSQTIIKQTFYYLFDKNSERAFFWLLASLWLWSKTLNHPGESSFEGHRGSAQCKALGLSCCPLGCLMVMHGCSRHTASVHSRLQWISPSSSCGEGGRVGGCVCDFSLSVCVSVRKSEREHGGEQEIVKVLCEARTPGEMFCAVGVFLRMSSTCFGAVGWCVKCTPPGRQLGRCDVGPLCRMCVAVWVDIG